MRAGLLLLIVSCLGACARSHTLPRRGEADSGVQDAAVTSPGSPVDGAPPACEAGLPVETATLSDAQNIFLRVEHEVAHLVDFAEQVQDSRRPDELDMLPALDEPFEFRRDEDEGFMLVQGRRFAATEFAHSDPQHLTLSIRFVNYTGGHGGFGPAALDGALCVEVTHFRGLGSPPPDAAVVRGVVALNGGGALVPAPAATVAYQDDWDVEEGASRTGSVGGFSVVEL